ncbi:NAD(P)/FAD-dependent oxidoreductase [Pseudoroseicyclus tamaricis]|uniref:FAD-binding oxidoreductase n=1 Tax=Pseudoroseicyclus tamaricis TaxID=2705421 RepID=A0A6B2K050_9RHOB|nr:FAD-binding oxidoreductase [Pseudoroseicyclus tamaricis]NDU99695.1 FAD-binding oxidoreductase [Pseudoroseicyclus tamaricis]
MPARRAYDLVIIGGGITGASTAFWAMKARAGFSVLVVERDATYAQASTTHTNSCIRLQFGTEVNIRLSQATLALLADWPEVMEEASPPPALDPFGYLYLAATEEGARRLRSRAALQKSLGARTVLLEPGQLAARFPWMEREDILLASHGTEGEGYFDGATLFSTFRRRSREMGAEWVEAEVAGLTSEGARITGIRLADGTVIAAGAVVNAAGPRAALVARWAGIELPVEPRRRHTFTFAAAPLAAKLPLTIDPSGFHVRQDGANFMIGCAPLDDDPAAPDDFSMDPDTFEERLWPALAARIPAFEQLRLLRFWTGHYAYNTHDQNALVGLHPAAEGLYFANGFSGHGLQQAAGIGRGLVELILTGGYQSLDLTPLSVSRLVTGKRVVEDAII